METCRKYPDEERLILGSMIYIPRLKLSADEFIPDRCGTLEAVESRAIKVRFPSGVLFGMWLCEYQNKWFTEPHYRLLEKWLKTFPDLTTGYLTLVNQGHDPNFLKQIIRNLDGAKWLIIKNL